MERIFTKDAGTLAEAGDLRDYPNATWERIAVDMQEPLDDFSIGVADSAGRLAAEFAAHKE